jgi:predicted membrane channel-forming protein YqfA (hemolysin III family)
MMPVMCFEVLLATIMLWISLFGISDHFIAKIEKDEIKLIVYAMMALMVLVFVYASNHINACALM